MTQAIDEATKTLIMIQKEITVIICEMEDTIFNDRVADLLEAKVALLRVQRHISKIETTDCVGNI